jgi:integrase
MDTATLDWTTEASNDRYLYELSDSFLNYLNSEQDMPVEELEILENEIGLSGEVVENLNNQEMESMAKSSKIQMDNTIKRFTTFLTEKNLSNDLLKIPPRLLNDYLRYFYSSLRTTDNRYYATPSLICFRAAIHRYFCLNRPSINIIEDPIFRQSNRMLTAMVAKYKKSGQVKVEEKYPAIEYADMAKIKQHFDRSTATILQQEIMFNFMYYFSLRGRETLPLLNKNSIICEKDSNDRQYLRIGHELLSKNAKASLKQTEFEDLKKARAYENIDNPSECPVQAWKLYAEKNCTSHLFPKPSVNKTPRNKLDFCANKVLGKHSIDNFMPGLSVNLNLSKRYTNHCVRVTMITILKENGFSNEEIATISGHKNAGSVQRYCRKRRDNDYEGITTALHNGATGNHVQIQQVSKKSKVVTVTHNDSANASNQISLHFTGTFENCHFNIHPD